MSIEALIALGGLVVALVSGLASYVAAGAAIKVHLHYLRRDVDQVRGSVRAAHWRLDEHGAPPAPTMDR